MLMFCGVCLTCEASLMSLASDPASVCRMVVFRTEAAGPSTLRPRPRRSMGATLAMTTDATVGGWPPAGSGII